MSRNLSLVEPHPTVPKSGGYIGGGRGGAGNFKRYKPEELSDGQTATGPASRISLTRPFKRTVPAGRGGAGNMVNKVETEEPMFQFDEEMIKARHSVTPVYHIGRGGAGNLFTEAHPKPRQAGERKDSTDSSASDRSQRVTARDSIYSMFSRRSA